MDNCTDLLSPLDCIELNQASVTVSPTMEPEGGSSGLSAGAAAGIAIGVVVAIAGVAGTAVAVVVIMYVELSVMYNTPELSILDAQRIVLLLSTVKTSVRGGGDSQLPVTVLTWLVR